MFRCFGVEHEPHVAAAFATFAAVAGLVLMLAFLALCHDFKTMHALLLLAEKDSQLNHALYSCIDDIHTLKLRGLFDRATLLNALLDVRGCCSQCVPL